MFRVRKFYLDCVTNDGTVFIGYVATLNWGWLRVQHASYLLSAEHAPPREASSWQRARLPIIEGDTMRWSNRRLQLHGEWRARCPRIEKLLYEQAGGRVRWICHQPASDVQVTIGDVALAGRGYCEELRISIPPWQLPIDELEWGRYSDDTDSLVWITWHGAHELQLTFLNGEETAEPVALSFAETRTLRHDTLTEMLQSAPLVGNALARHFGATLEHKMLSRGLLGDHRGWIIHESVRWRTKQTA